MFVKIVLSIVSAFDADRFDLPQEKTQLIFFLNDNPNQKGSEHFRLCVSMAQLWLRNLNNCFQKELCAKCQIFILVAFDSYVFAMKSSK